VPGLALSGRTREADNILDHVGSYLVLELFVARTLTTRTDS
jgi:hypothetical protein